MQFLKLISEGSAAVLHPLSVEHMAETDRAPGSENGNDLSWPFNPVSSEAIRCHVDGCLPGTGLYVKQAVRSFRKQC